MYIAAHQTMDLFWAGCLICSSKCFTVMKASSFSPGPPDLRRFDLCGMVWMTDLCYCPYQAVVIKIRIASQVLTENPGQVVTLSFWPYTLFMRLLSWCWPCKTVLQKRSLMPPPPAMYLCSLQFHGLFCNSTFTTCEIQPGLVVWSVTFVSVSLCYLLRPEASHVVSHSFPHPEVKFRIGPGPSSPNSTNTSKRNKTFQIAFS